MITCKRVSKRKIIARASRVSESDSIGFSLMGVITYSKKNHQNEGK